MSAMIAVNTKHTGDPSKDHRGYAEPMTSEQLDKLLAEAWLKKMVTDIRGGNEKLKDRLPYICPHYSRFQNNHRAQADIIPEAFTFMTCVDVDDKELVDQAIKQALELNGDEYSDWKDQVLRIEYSARKKCTSTSEYPRAKRSRKHKNRSARRLAFRRLTTRVA